MDPIEKTGFSRSLRGNGYLYSGVKILTEQEKIQIVNHIGAGDLVSASREIVAGLLSLSGTEALNKILDHDNPVQLVRNMTRIDLFWLIKKIGENDSLPLLKLASLDQWQYILDMELWNRDRINLGETFEWLDRLQKADPDRLAHWLLSEDGNFQSYFYFSKALEVKIKEDDDFEPPEGSITFDNLFYILIRDKDHEEGIEQILRTMANENYNLYQALLLGLAGVIPAEVEEEMYRLRSVRLAEDGYLPFEEAISVYAHQQADLLKKDESEYRIYLPDDAHTRALVPVTPFMHAQGDNLFAKSLVQITDNLFLDRLRLEFAGLCNQIFSADGVKFEGLEVLINISRKSAGYINIGLERLSGGNIEISKNYIKNNPLISIFRVGFGLSLELKWETEKWLKQSWFLKQGLKPFFWGDEWGGILKGILKKKPLFFSGLREGREYRHFESLSELEKCRNVIHRLVSLDRLLETISSEYPLDMDLLKDPLLNFQPLLFSFWARGQLKLGHRSLPLSLEQTKEFFRLIRGEEKGPPFRMPGFREIFIQDFISYETGLEPDEKILLKDTLSLLWEEFSEEYALVEASDLDARFTKFIMIDDQDSRGPGIEGSN